MAKRFLPYALTAAVAAAAHLSGLLEPFDGDLSDYRMEVLERKAGGELIIVQIDAKSLRELNVWPWPRGYHAVVVDRLVAAGAIEIALDIDFSSRGTLGPDDPLVNSVNQAGGRVILPVFQQSAQGRRDQSKFVKTEPLPKLAKWVQLGSANVFAAEDGLIRQVEAVTMISGERFPAIFALLAGPAFIEHGVFYVDYGIRAESIPRISYVDIFKGRFDPSKVHNKKIIVGAVAAELGDNFAVPAQRIISGTELQGLAFESMVQGRALTRLSPWVMIFVSTLAVFLFGLRRFRRSWGLSVFLGLALLVLMESAALAASNALPLIVPNAVWLISVIFATLFNVGATLKERGEEILKHKLDQIRRRRLMQAVMEQAFEGIVVAERDGAIRDANASASRLLRRRREEIIGVNIRSFLPVIARAMRHEAETAGDRKSEHASHFGPVEQQIKLKGGGVLEVELSLSKVMLGQGTDDEELLVIAMRDIGHRKAAERAREEAHRKALEADRAKTEFLANMSHELRTPLNAIIGFSEVIGTGQLGPVQPPQYGDYAKDILTSGKHLLGIINRILDISQIELGEVEVALEEVRTADLVCECLDIVKGWRASQDKSINYVIEPGADRLVTDPSLMRQILINLLSNSVKFTKSTGHIAVEVKCGPESLEVRVVDNGIGIPPESISTITEPFAQVESTLAKNHDGVGLGLALVSKYVTLLGGTLEFESELGKGTTAIVRLRQPKVPASESGAAAA